MGKGSLTRAVQRTGGLEPVISTFRDLMNRKEQQDYYDNAINAWKQSQQQQQGLGTEQLPVQQPNNALIGQDIQSIPDMELPVTSKPNIQTNFNQIQSPQNYEKAQDIANNFSAEQLLNAVKTPGVNTNIVNALSGLLQNSAERYKHQPHTFREIPSGGIQQEYDESGNLVKTTDNPREFQPKTDKVIHSFTGTDNQPYSTFQKEDGSSYTLNLLTGKPANPNMKVRENTADNSLGWTRLFYEMNKDKEKGTDVKETAQDKYNTVMGSPYVKMDDLVSQGIEDNPPLNPDGSYKYGGAYVTRDKNGKTHVIYSDEMLNNFAKSQVPDAPNKWDRQKGQSNNSKPSTQQPSAGNNQVPQAAIDHLKSHPELKSYFDQKYGKGSSDKYLEGK